MLYTAVIPLGFSHFKSNTHATPGSIAVCVEDEPGVANWMHAFKSKANTNNLKYYAWEEMMEVGACLRCPTSINGNAHLTLVTSIRRRIIGKGGRGIRKILAAWSLYWQSIPHWLSSLLTVLQKSAGLWSLRGHLQSVGQWRCTGIQMVLMAGAYVHARTISEVCYV